MRPPRLRRPGAARAFLLLRTNLLSPERQEEHDDNDADDEEQQHGPLFLGCTSAGRSLCRWPHERGNWAKGMTQLRGRDRPGRAARWPPSKATAAPTPTRTPSFLIPSTPDALDRRAVEPNRLPRTMKARTPRA